MLKESAESAPALTVTHDDVVEASRSPLHESIACTTAAAAAEEHSVMIHVATFGNAMDVRARVCICACANARVRIYLHTGFWLVPMRTCNGDKPWEIEVVAPPVLPCRRYCVERALRRQAALGASAHGFITVQILRWLPRDFQGDLRQDCVAELKEKWLKVFPAWSPASLTRSAFGTGDTGPRIAACGPASHRGVYGI